MENTNKGSFYIPVIEGSTRRGRESVKVARFVHELMRQRETVETEMLDLLEYDFPMMEERLRFRDDPPSGLPEFSEKIARSDALVIVTVSAGGFGGINCLAQLRLVVLGLGAFPIPAALPVSRVQEAFDDAGNSLDPSFEKRAAGFIDEVLWFAEAVAAQKANTSAS